MGRYLLYVIPILSTFPIFLTLATYFNSRLLTNQEILWAIGLTIGTLSFLIIWWQFVLGIRPVSTSLFTKDLVWINNLHKKVGTYGFLFILLHPIIIYLDRIVSGLGIILPSVETIADRGYLLGQVAILLLGTVWLASAIYRSKLGYRVWKRIHFINYIVLVLVFIHSTTVGFLLENIYLRLYWYILFAIFCFLVIYRLLFQFGIVIKKRYSVISLDQLTHDSFRIRLKPQSGRVPSPSMGQFVYAQLSRVGENHPYTVSFFDEESGEISIVTKDLGKFSKKLHKLSLGDTVFLDGPYGVFTKEAYETKNPLVLVVGGIGITPFLRLIEIFKKEPERFNGITLIYGNKTIEDIAFKDEFDAVKLPNFKVVHVLSDDATDHKYERGFITAELIKKHTSEELKTYDFFVCGPPIMMSKVIPDLIKSGAEESRVYSEKFSL